MCRLLLVMGAEKGPRGVCSGAFGVGSSAAGIGGGASGLWRMLLAVGAELGCRSWHEKIPPCGGVLGCVSGFIRHRLLPGVQ